LGQCNEPQHQANGVHATSPKLSLHVDWDVGGKSLVPQQRQHDKQATKIPKELRLKGIHLHGKTSGNGVQQRKSQATQSHPGHAAHRCWQSFKTTRVL
jgi:hypothetical protein